MNFLELETVFKMRVVYKSGYTHDFEVLKFTFDGREYQWIATGPSYPIKFGGDEIAAVWQIGVRKRIKWKK